MEQTRRRFLLATAAAGTATLGTAGASQSDGWSTTFDDGNDEYAAAVAPLPDGFVLAGRSYADELDHYWWLEVDRSGQKRASGRFERESDGGLGGVAVAEDGGFLLAGADRSVTSTTPWVRRYGPDRELLWSYDPGEDDEGFRPVRAVATGDGRFLLAGISEQLGSSLRGATRTLGADGRLRDERQFEERTTIEAAARRPTGGAVLGGARGSTRDRTGWIVAVDAEGAEDWRRTYNETSLDDPVRGVYDLHVADDGLAMAATIGSDVGVVGADAEGAVEWSAAVDGEQAKPTLARVGDGYVLGGSYVLADSSYEYLLASVDPDDGVQWASRYADGESLGDIVGVDARALFAGSDGRDAVVRTFDGSEPPSGGDVLTSGAGAGSGAGQEGDDGSGSEDDSGGETDDGLPGFGVATAAAGLAGAGLLRRRLTE